MISYSYSYSIMYDYLFITYSILSCMICYYLFITARRGGRRGETFILIILTLIHILITLIIIIILWLSNKLLLSFSKYVLFLPSGGGESQSRVPVHNNSY